LSDRNAPGEGPVEAARENSAPPAIGSVMPLPDVCDAPATSAPAASLWALWSAEGTQIAAYGCARAALRALLALRGVSRVWLPAYACSALAEATAGLERRWIDVDAALHPGTAGLGRGLEAGDAVVGIDYFGRPPHADFLTLVGSRPDVLWIEDRAQAIDTGMPAWGEVVLYSPRKLIGVGDGGVLVGDGPLPPPFGRPPPPPEAQRARARDPQGLQPQRWFPAFQAQERQFGPDCGLMSPMTRQILERVAGGPLIAARQANARRLARALPDLALWPGEAFDFAPMAFPIRVADRDALAAALAAEAIYCAKHWSTLPSDPRAFPGPHALAAEILSLPCDHRYGPADMDRVAAALRRLGARRPGSAG
jgi:dTDP-4-amino-4,6-dideoxygalactose transaminase